MMARQPLDVLANSPKPTGRPAIWAAIRKLRNFSVNALCRETDIPKGTISEYIAGLFAANIIELTKVGEKFVAAEYRLMDDRGSEAPRVRKDGSEVTQGLGIEAMWRTLKIAGLFTAEDLALQATTEKAPVAVQTVKFYLQFLNKAGFISTINYSGPGRPSQFRFVKSKDPGPLPPQIQRVKQVFDPNSNKVVWPKPDGGTDR